MKGTASGRFRDLARLDATGANLHALRAALRTLNAYGLQIRIKAATRPIVCVRDIIAELRPLAADFTTFCHDCFNPQTLFKSANSFSSQR